MGGDLHAGAVENRLPVDELGATRLAEPGAPLGRVGLQLDQIAAERLLEAGECRLDTVGRMAERCLPAAGRARLGFTPRPPLEQAAEGERRDLEGEQLRDQLARGLVLDRMLGDDRGPLGLRDGAHQTSTTTGRIIGRRRVRS